MNKAKVKERTQKFGRKLRLMWHFWNDHWKFDINPFRKKSKFNPKGNATIETYLSCLENEILYLDEKMSYSNLTNGERNALYLIRNDRSIIIKKVLKRSMVVVWNREDYIREANDQLCDKYIYWEGDAVNPLMKVMESVLRSIRNNDLACWCDVGISDFLMNNPKLGRFYLAPKIHKILHKERYTKTSMKIVHFSRPPTQPTLSTYVQNSSSSLTLYVQFQMNPPSSLSLSKW